MTKQKKHVLVTHCYRLQPRRVPKPHRVNSPESHTCWHTQNIHKREKKHLSTLFIWFLTII